MSTLQFKWHADRVFITGSRDEEKHLRQQLEDKLANAMRAACPDWFGATGWPERIAFDFAWNCDFYEHAKTRTVVQGLAVEYRNKGAWLPWIEVDAAPTDRRMAIRSNPVSSYDILVKEKGFTRKEAKEKLRDKTVRARAKAERQKQAKKKARKASSPPRRKKR